VTVLQVVAFVLPALGAPALALTRDPLRMVLVAGVYGWTLLLLFVVLGAPDVALSMLVVSTVAYPLILLVAIARVRGLKPDEGS
jgi:energy-converting hydrogenase B subunit D